MATATKASIQAELLATQAELAVLREQVAAASEQTRSDELRQSLWLRPLGDRQGRSVHPNTGKVSFKFTANLARYDKRAAKYVYGPDKVFIAYNNGYGDLADKLVEIYASDERLVTISAFEVPWSDGSYRSDWTVTSIEVKPRSQAPVQSHQPLIDPEIL